jgi:PASTA domain
MVDDRRPDETGPMEPMDSTAPMEPTESTAPMEPTESTAPMEPTDSTAPMDAAADRPDATRAMPPVADEPARWSGSARVPQPGTAALRPPDYEYAEPPGPDDERSWLTPVVAGLIGLVLLGALVIGMWLIFTADDSPPAAPPTSPPTPPVSSPVPTTTRPPTTPPTTTAVPRVEVPPVVGLSEAEARQRLADSGLRVSVVRRADPSAEPGTVLSADPPPGTEVALDSVVRLVVAAPSAPPSSPSR